MRLLLAFLGIHALAPGLSAQRHARLYHAAQVEMDRGRTQEALDLFTRSYRSKANSPAAWGMIRCGQQLEQRLDTAFCLAAIDLSKHAYVAENKAAAKMDHIEEIA